MIYSTEEKPYNMYLIQTPIVVLKLKMIEYISKNRINIENYRWYKQTTKQGRNMTKVYEFQKITDDLVTQAFNIGLPFDLVEMYILNK